MEAIDPPAGEIREHAPHGLCVGGPRQPWQGEVERIEPVRELQVFDDARVADVADWVARPPAALALELFFEMTPRAGVEGPSGNQPELSLLLVLLDRGLEDHPVGVGWLEAGEAPPDAGQLPAGAGDDIAGEVGHSFAAGGLLHG